MREPLRAQWGRERRIREQDRRRRVDTIGRVIMALGVVSVVVDVIVIALGIYAAYLLGAHFGIW